MRLGSRRMINEAISGDVDTTPTIAQVPGGTVDLRMLVGEAAMLDAMIAAEVDEGVPVAERELPLSELVAGEFTTDEE